jgi:hypothetical protein
MDNINIGQYADTELKEEEIRFRDLTPCQNANKKKLNRQSILFESRNVQVFGRDRNDLKFHQRRTQS